MDGFVEHMTSQIQWSVDIVSVSKYKLSYSCYEFRFLVTSKLYSQPVECDKIANWIEVVNIEFQLLLYNMPINVINRHVVQNSLGPPP